MEMIEVNKEKFFECVYPLDIEVSPIGKYPYTSIFKIKGSNKLVGKIIKSGLTYPYTTTYQIEKSFLK